MKNKILLIICISIFTLLLPNGVKAFQVTDNQTVDSNKVWTIKFTDEVGFDDLTKNSIIITDSKGNKLNVILDLGQDNKTIIVNSPVDGYTEGENYTLSVGKNAHDKKGKQMKQNREIHFNIKKSTSNADLEVINSSIDLPKNPNDEDNYIIIGKRKFEVGQFKQLMLGYEDRINDVINSMNNCTIGTGGYSDGQDIENSEFGISVKQESDSEKWYDTLITCGFNGNGMKSVSLTNIPTDYNMKAISSYFPEKYTLILQDMNIMQEIINEEMDNNMDDIQDTIHNKTSKLFYTKTFVDKEGMTYNLQISVFEGRFKETMSFDFE